MFCLSTVVSLVLCAAAPSPGIRPVGTVADLVEAIREERPTPYGYDITADVTYVSTNIADEKTNVALADASGCYCCRAEDRRGMRTLPRRGAHARCRGVVERNVYGRLFPVITNYEEIAVGKAPEPVPLTRSELFDGQHDFVYCRVEGTLRDVALNETDPYWLMLTICNDEGRIFATVPISDAGDLGHMERQIGDHVSVTGICVPYDHSPRIQTGRIFKIAAIDSIRFPGKEQDESRPTPWIECIRISQPSDIATLGRHQARGWVVAVWRDNHALLRTANKDIIGLEFSDGTPLPDYGRQIDAVGLPDTDLFRINLFNATWRYHGEERLVDDPPKNVSARTLTRDSTGRKQVNCEHHGHAIRIGGIVRSMSNSDGHHRIYVESDECLVPVDASAVPAALDSVTVDCRIQVTGTCVLEVDAPRMTSAIPRLLGFSVIIRKPDDLTIVARPPWWTPGRLLTLVGALFATLLAILAWNTALRKLVEKRGKDLARESIAHVASDLKVYERTRLAVELHDSIAQALTGISLEIDTVERLADVNPAKMHEHLAIASTSLKSCRTELRNCLWDLRHQALEMDDMEAAIRQTLDPHVTDIVLAIRFKVPRERISDNTAHAILRIVRELTVNAIRHGGATNIKVAGCIDGDKLRFSVQDNGCGFDPANCPGDEQGHYGLLGIRERVNSFEGRMTVESSPGAGSKTTIYLSIPQEQPTDRTI